jgi:hypothetical protein
MLDWHSILASPLLQRMRDDGTNFVHDFLRRIRRQMGIALCGGRMIVSEHFADDRKKGQFGRRVTPLSNINKPLSGWSWLARR